MRTKDGDRQAHVKRGRGCRKASRGFHHLGVYQSPKEIINLLAKDDLFFCFAFLIACHGCWLNLLNFLVNVGRR